MHSQLVLMTLIIIGAPVVGSAVFQWLWNITMPDVFSLKRIRYWQAFRLLVMAFILFGWTAFGN